MLLAVEVCHLQQMRFLSSRRGGVGFGEEAGGGHGVTEEGLCCRVRACHLPSALREANPWHWLHVQGMVCLPGEPGEAERNSRDTHLAFFGLFGGPVAGKNLLFFRTLVTQGVHFRVIWYRREIGRFICWVTLKQGGMRWKMKPRQSCGICLSDKWHPLQITFAVRRLFDSFKSVL